MTSILKFYNFVDPKWLDNLKSSSNFTKFGAVARVLLKNPGTYYT